MIWELMKKEPARFLVIYSEGVKRNESDTDLNMNGSFAWQAVPGQTFVARFDGSVIAASSYESKQYFRCSISNDLATRLSNTSKAVSLERFHMLSMHARCVCSQLSPIHKNFHKYFVTPFKFHKSEMLVSSRRTIDVALFELLLLCGLLLSNSHPHHVQ